MVIISGEQQRDSAIHIHVSILPKTLHSAIHIHVSSLPQTLLPFRLPHNIEQSSMCYTVGSCWLSILNIAVHVHPKLDPVFWFFPFTPWVPAQAYPSWLVSKVALWRPRAPGCKATAFSPNSGTFKTVNYNFLLHLSPTQVSQVPLKQVTCVL